MIKERCEDPECKGYGKELVDRGYGYPVCPTTKQNLYHMPMLSHYKGKYDLEL